MPKLRKHRPEPSRTSPPPSTTSSPGNLNPWTPRPPSLLSTGSRAAAAPVPLKSVAPVVAVAEVQAGGNGGEAVSGTGEWETAVRQQGESPAASTSTSPARSSHRRIVSTSTIATVSSHTSLEPIPSSSSVSALAKLRESLDADQHAKEAKKVAEVQVKRMKSHEGWKLRKKLPRERVERGVAAEEEEERHEHEQEEVAKEEEQGEAESDGAAPPFQELRVGEALVVEVEMSADGTRPDEDEREGGLDAIPPVASQLPPHAPTSASPAPVPASAGHTLVSLALAPARLGWRAARLPFDVASFAASTSLNLAASTVALGTDVAAKTLYTGLQLATNVPVVGLVAAKVPRLRESCLTEEAEEEQSPPHTPHLPPLTPPIDHFDAALVASDSPPSTPTHPHHPVLDTVTKPLSLVRSGVEISLGLGLAGALVAGAVGELAWSAVRGGRKEGKDESRGGSADA
ncbi:hypothetical protein RTBOTA2_006143 [Rhodotorula toruloides]|uniref:Uncharacterized protein n=1 Tax=Rhodotorula toruloides TaxID=5286 RepID=A0A2S9ZZF5_RHOTO|nr:hypothetical protein RTBOTA2_006143 [Rhodotorula toruloides]PRQ71132.1 hypothetical protein AAT19DRAFT_10672 [Rhodotorula toruloides]